MARFVKRISRPGVDHWPDVPLFTSHTLGGITDCFERPHDALSEQEGFLF